LTSAENTGGRPITHLLAQTPIIPSEPACQKV